MVLSNMAPVQCSSAQSLTHKLRPDCFANCWFNVNFVYVDQPAKQSMITFTPILIILILVIRLAKITKRKSWQQPLHYMAYLCIEELTDFFMACHTHIIFFQNNTFFLPIKMQKHTFLVRNMNLQKKFKKLKLAWKHDFQPFGVFASGCNTFFPHYSSSSHNLLHKRSRKNATAHSENSRAIATTSHTGNPEW